MGKGKRRQNDAYDWQQIEQLRGVPLPAKLKCGMCDKNYNQNRFSQKQLTDARYQVHTKGTITKHPRCLTCCGSNFVEIECVGCHKTKGLEDFAKSQRKVLDTAMCYNCMEAQVSREAINEDIYWKDDKQFIREEMSNGGWPEYWKSAKSCTDTESNPDEWKDTPSVDGSRPKKNEDGGIDLSAEFQQAVSLEGSSAVTEALIGHEYDRPPSEAAKTESWHTPSNAASASGLGSGPRTGGKPGNSVAGSMHSFNSSRAEYGTQSSPSIITSRSGFAKIKASENNYDDNPWARNTGRAYLSDPSDDEDEEGGKDDSDDEDGDYAP
ncbi:hypothetical protein E8E13_008478 [Curvularia kusanoi]|uniref:Stc1 domain-containing protein n=1 Tax=Curvularia kusanoi TaxID=90978 RepID=A0A9P4WBY9_CURKU|nr:hypothetical protein E8E13_008478 [Curvularia kusanoi]